VRSGTSDSCLSVAIAPPASPVIRRVFGHVSGSRKVLDTTALG
jgi:hypothetical protein